jgi:hypothetical protein
VAGARRLGSAGAVAGRWRRGSAARWLERWPVALIGRWRRCRSGGGAVPGGVGGGAVAAPSIGRATATLAAESSSARHRLLRNAKCVQWGRRRKGGGIIYPTLVPVGGFSQD